VRRRETGVKGRAFSAPDAKVLVTDDNEFNLRVATGLLGLMDITAETADSGAEAIGLIRQNDYDIVFMDHMMPEMDGEETVREIRASGEYNDLIIVALTANAVSGAREMFLENGFNDFISKPINIGELQDVLERHLPPGKVRAAGESKVMSAASDTKEVRAAGINKSRPAVPDTEEARAAGADKNRLAVQDREDQEDREDREEQLRRKLIVTFVKENRDTFAGITGSLAAGDIKTAHRIAHTLKSTAGYLGKTALQEAALSLEKSLRNGAAIDSATDSVTVDPASLYTPLQLEALERELSSALREFEPVAAEAETEAKAGAEAEAEAKAGAGVGELGVAQISGGELAALLKELEPLLEQGDFGATEYTGRLRGAPGMEELAQRIDDYDFEGALLLLRRML